MGLSPAQTRRDIALALVRSGIRPVSKLATTGWWAETTVAADLGVAEATTEQVYAATDWLVARQDAIETKLVRTHLNGPGKPDRLALFDLSSSWVTGRCCPLAARGYSRDVPSLIPRSRATCATGFPVSRTIRTAPSRISWSNFPRFSDMTTPHSACLHGFGEVQNPTAADAAAHPDAAQHRLPMPHRLRHPHAVGRSTTVEPSHVKT